MRVVWLLPAALSLHFLASTREAETVKGTFTAAQPTFDKVLTLLNNLLLQIDRDAAEDDQDWSAFQGWYSGQEQASTESVGGLNAKLAELAASLSDLRAHHLTTTASHENLQGELSEENTQLDAATSKRQEEHDAFVKEQLDFDQSIAATTRAADILQTHFGDGTVEEVKAPEWLGLASVLATVKSAAKRHHITAFTQLNLPSNPGSSLYDVYEPSTNEAVSVTDQVRTLGKTFESDKQSAVDQENSLVTAFTTLTNEKKKMVGSLTDQIAELKAVATSASEQIAEKSAAEQAAQVALENEQAYLSALRQQNRDTETNYNQRKSDRDSERDALRSAQGLLGAPSLLQFHGAPAGRAALVKAAALLRQQATSQRSELLLSAASVAASPEALGDVVTELQGLIDRIKEDQAHEVAHADWCRHEMSEASEKQTKHEGLGAEASTSLQTSQDFAGAKQEELQETHEEVEELDADWAQQKELRAKLHDDFEAQQRDASDAIAALKEAEALLTQHYAAGASLVQQPQRDEAPASNLNAGYQQSGGGVVSALATLRADFEKAAGDAAAAEAQAVQDFAASQARYTTSRTALVDTGTQLEQQLQAAASDQSTFQENLKSHQEAVASATAYLADLRSSCASLIQNLSAREQSRTEEAAAINDAIAILRAS